ncbi:MAG: putative manganese transporter [Spirochaetota bacterium]
MIEVLKDALFITVFVFVTMLLIEYINVLTSGGWQKILGKRLWHQYILAGILGASPGCLGAFASVAMYTHGVLSMGSVVTAMIATSGDEWYVMLAMFPKKTLFITLFLFLIGIVAGSISDLVFKKGRNQQRCIQLSLHMENSCECIPSAKLIEQWKSCSPTRGILTVILLIIVVSIALGELGPSTWDWMRITILVVTSIALFIVCTVPDHFLDEHLWKHVVLKHVPKIFLWTAGAMILLWVVTEHLNINIRQIAQSGKWLMLVLACLIGIIPESGPHLIFVTLFSEGIIPFSVLLASSIVQDGHGMLPMLAYSRVEFIKIKAINFATGIFIGAIVMLMGF